MRCSKFSRVLTVAAAALCVALPSATAAPAAPGEQDLAMGYTREHFKAKSAAYEQGTLTSRAELVRLAKLMLAYDSAANAAGFLDKEMKSGRVRRTGRNSRLLGDMWLLAREWEKARSIWTSITYVSFPAELDLKVGWTYLVERNWQFAETHLRRALAKGGIRNPCHTRLLLGHVLGEGDTPGAALEQYGRAAETEACGSLAAAWAVYAGLAGHQNMAATGRPVATPVATQEKDPKADYPAADALRACQSGSFEITEDGMAKFLAQRATIAAVEKNPLPGKIVRNLQQQEFEESFLEAMGRLNAGALERAQRDLAATEAATAGLGEDPGTNDALAKLLNACADLHKSRLQALKQAQSLLTQAETAAGKRWADE